MGDLMNAIRISLLTWLAGFLAVGPLPVSADDSADLDQGPAAVVRAFNDSISSGDVEGAVAMIAPGGAMNDMIMGATPDVA